MNIHQLHIADKSSANAGMQECTPCEPPPAPKQPATGLKLECSAATKTECPMNA